MLCCWLEGLRWLWEAAEQQQQGGLTSHRNEQTAFALGEQDVLSWAQHFLIPDFQRAYHASGADISKF